MKLKGKLLASTSALVMVSGLAGVAAPAAHALVLSPVIIDTSAGPQTVGTCEDQVQLIKLTTPTKGVGLGDQTRDNVKAAGALAKDQTTKAAIGGTCSGVTPHGDKHIPFPATGSQGESGLTSKAMVAVLTGNSTCAQNSTPPGTVFDADNDATADNAYPLHGKITWTFNETYTDLLDATKIKPYKMQAAVQVLGFNPVPGPDVIDVGGIVLSGVNAGAAVTGQVWFDPVAKTGGATGYNTGYEVDLAAAIGCQDDPSSPSPATTDNANITQVLSGGGASTPSLLGSSATGLSFAFGE